MAQTVSECLTAATDSVTVINDINSKGKASDHITASDPSAGVTQADANAAVKRNVDHLTTILAYDGTNETPNVKDASDNKSSYTTAITTGNTYISNNS
tara:strand:- start:321 stop:614 length:294 start_codon:yes stop_codon:yes gene_type:complete